MKLVKNMKYACPKVMIVGLSNVRITSASKNERTTARTITTYGVHQKMSLVPYIIPSPTKARNIHDDIRIGKRVMVLKPNTSIKTSREEKTIPVNKDSNR